MSTYLRKVCQKISGRNNDKNSQSSNDSSIIQNTNINTGATIPPTKSDPPSVFVNGDSDLGSNESDTISIITDDPSIVEASEEHVLDFQRYSKNLTNIIKATEPKFAVGIFGKWGTGKTTLMKMIKQELDKDNEKILTVWFDAWRYEREKNVAVIPFLRQIRIALDKDLNKKKEGKSPRWEKLRDALEKTFDAFILSTEFSISPSGSPISTKTNLGKFRDMLRAKGSTIINDKRMPLVEHSTDYLQDALNQLKDARIVVFVDDLDRCTPQNALEVIESIKTFFDLRGIVYVIGMDSESINHIIRQKYGEDSKIDGMKYLEKIVQLPFQIPVWKREDIHTYISKITSKALRGPKLANEFEKEIIRELIVKAIEPNPRQVKRFINNVILANKVFSSENIEIDKLIAVQALNFRPEWNRFLDLITPNPVRKIFFDYYYIPLKKEGKVINSKDDSFDNFKKEKDNEQRPMPEVIMDIFQELMSQKDNALRSFLDAGADEKLGSIERMEGYQRALAATKIEEETHRIDRQAPTKKLLLQLLSTGRTEEFNSLRIAYSQIYPDLSDVRLPHANLSYTNLSAAHLPFANLSNANLSDAELSSAYLSNANLSYANFLGARLYGTTFSFANLSYTNLSAADLSHDNLSGANLLKANLSRANLSYSRLSYADFSSANLIEANLIEANLIEAKLPHANLSKCDLSGANLSNANLMESDLSNANLSGANLSYTNLSRANLSNSIIIGGRYQQNRDLRCVDADFKDAIIDDNDLSIRLSKGSAKNVPSAARNRKDLRKMLLEHTPHLDADDIDTWLSFSILKE